MTGSLYKNNRDFGGILTKLKDSSTSSTEKSKEKKSNVVRQELSHGTGHCLSSRKGGRDFRGIRMTLRGRNQ